MIVIHTGNMNKTGVIYAVTPVFDITMRHTRF